MHTALGVILVVAALLGLHSARASISVQDEVTSTVIVTLTSINVTEIQWTTMTVPTYETSTTILTETSKTINVESTTTTYVTSVPYPTYFVTTIADKTVLKDVVWPSQTSLRVGLVAFYVLGSALGLVTVLGARRKEEVSGELMGGLLAGLGFVLWAIIQFLGGFPSESAQLGFGGTFGYVWQSLIVLVLGLFFGFCWLAHNYWFSAAGVGECVGFFTFVVVASYSSIEVAIGGAVIAGIIACAISALMSYISRPLRRPTAFDSERLTQLCS